MSNLEKRILVLENERAKVNLQSMSDEELDGYIRTLSGETPDWYAAVLTRIGRKGSTLPIVVNDPDYSPVR